MIDKNTRIKQTIKETRERHAGMRCRVYRVKILERKLSRKQREHLNLLFLEAKWQYNHILSVGYEKAERSPKIVSVLCGDCFEDRELSHLSAQMKQDIYDGVISTIKGLSTKKKKGEKVGRLKFKSIKHSIPLRQYGNTYKIDWSKETIKLAKLAKPLKVKGLKQIPSNAEITSAKLIRKPSGLYFHITVFEEKADLQKTRGVTGIDFGIKHNLTTTQGEVFDISIPESKAIKLASKRVNKAYAKTKSKKTSNHKKRVHQLQKAYEKNTNRKKDIANKVVNHLLSQYHFIAIQDEMIRNWHKGLFGKQVQHSAMGAIIAKLKTNSATYVVDREYPSTQKCPICNKNTKHPLEQRIYLCDYCGYYHPSRDEKSAAMILLEALNQVCAERTAKSSVEVISSTMEECYSIVYDVLYGKIPPMKQEAQVL